MKITRDNYEIYFLDYLEGNLEEELVDEFIEFLQQNADLKEELQLAGDVKLPADDVSFEHKDQLLKNKYDLTDEFNYAAIALMEGDLSEKEKAEFETYLARHPSMHKDIELFKKTRLQAEENIIFKDKSRLYHADQGRTILLWFTRIAAVMAVAFLVYRFGGDLAVREFYPENNVVVTENKEEKPDPEVIRENAAKKEEPAPVRDEKPDSERKPENKSQPAKSLRESNKGRIDHERTAQARVPVEVPEILPALHANLYTGERIYASLAQIKTDEYHQPVANPGERLLGDVVREKSGLDNLSLNKVARAGLSLVASISGEKFNYETNTEGQITELNFDSRLLAFSIPTNNNR